MDVLTTKEQVRAWRAKRDGAGWTRALRSPVEVGFVPTMGYLHEGHMSLVDRARAENDLVAASIFVNPTQFGPHEDLDSYPRDLDRDFAMLDDHGCHMVFVPEADELYPEGFQTYVEVGAVSRQLEGANRPGHFRGVATIVTKLFTIVQPTRAYFGRKDAQQLAVVQRLALDLDMDVEVVGCVTIREHDGLAMSSRNTYLNEQERAAAKALYRALLAARYAYLDGETDGDALKRAMRAVLHVEPLVRTEYVSIADPLTMTEIDEAHEGALVSLAATVGKTRLIDNITLEREKPASPGTADRGGQSS